MKREHQKEQRKAVNGVGPRDPALAVQKQIALRAYELYLERGGTDGHEVEDWLQAERDILSNREP